MISTPGFLYADPAISRQPSRPRATLPLEQFQEKWETVFRPELRQSKEMEWFGVSGKRRTTPVSGMQGSRCRVKRSRLSVLILRDFIIDL
jgi:hypothetical protein